MWQRPLVPLPPSATLPVAPMSSPLQGVLTSPAPVITAQAVAPKAPPKRLVGEVYHAPAGPVRLGHDGSAVSILLSQDLPTVASAGGGHDSSRPAVCFRLDEEDSEQGMARSHSSYPHSSAAGGSVPPPVSAPPSASGSAWPPGQRAQPSITHGGFQPSAYSAAPSGTAAVPPSVATQPGSVAPPGNHIAAPAPFATPACATPLLACEPSPTLGDPSPSACSTTPSCLENNASNPPPPPKLPNDWKAVWSEQHSKYYYWRESTNETTWERPASEAAAAQTPGPSQPPARAPQAPGQQQPPAQAAASQPPPAQAQAWGQAQVQQTVQPTGQHAEHHPAQVMNALQLPPTQPDPGLPSGWHSQWDNGSQKYYYYQVDSRGKSIAVQWERPACPQQQQAPVPRQRAQDAYDPWDCTLALPATAAPAVPVLVPSAWAEPARPLWRRAWSEAHRREYWYNERNDVTWDRPPTGAFDV